MSTTLFTGLPRSGTTLLCALINKFPNSVALAEPMNPIGSDAKSSILQLKEFILESRRSAVNFGFVTSKHVDGRITDDFVAAPPSLNELRSTLEQRGQVKVEKALSSDFRLFIKQPAWFTALAEELSRHFEMFVIVRNPLAVLASWQTVQMPVHQGQFPNACRFSQQLTDALAREPDQLRRQVLIIDWALNRYVPFLPDKVLKIEDLARDPTASLAKLGLMDARISFQYQFERPEVRYPNVDIEAMKLALQPIQGTIRIFYPNFPAV